METPVEYSDGFVCVELNATGIKNYLEKMIKDIETKVLVNLFLTNLIARADKKIQACELLLEHLETYVEIKEACYCLAYGTNLTIWKPVELEKLIIN